MAEVLDLSPLVNFVSQLQLAGKEYRRHAVASLNDAATFGRDQGVQAIADQIALTKSRVKQSFRIDKATQKAPIATISATAKPVNLADYKYSQQVTPTKDRRAKHAVKPDGLQAFIHKRKGAAVFRHVFLITGKYSGKTIAVERKYPNLPKNRTVKAVYGPSVYQLWRDERETVASGQITDYLVERFVERTGL